MIKEKKVVLYRFNFSSKNNFIGITFEAGQSGGTNI